jgi:hypothetical protein
MMMEVKTTRIPLLYLIISSLFSTLHPKTEKKFYENTMMTLSQDILDETICSKRFPDMQHGKHFETTLPNIYLAVQYVKKTNPNEENKPVNSTPTKFRHIHGIRFLSIW